MQEKVGIFKDIAKHVLRLGTEPVVLLTKVPLTLGSYLQNKMIE